MLYCFHGTDSYLLRQATADVAAAAHVKHGTDLHVTALDCSEPDASDEIERQIKYPSFFGEHKLIIAANAAGPVMTGILERFPLQELDDITLVAVQDTSHKDTDKKALKAIIKAADVSTEVAPLTGSALTDWIVGYCKQRGSAVAPGALTALIGRIGTHAGTLSLELEKLCSYAQGAPIDATMVELLTPRKPERDEWELSNAVSAYDKRKTITALWRKLQEGTPEQMLIGSLASGLRNLLMIKDLSSRRLEPAGIAKLTGMHPFVISKTLRGAASADALKLKLAHIALARLDRDSKEGLADSTDGLFAVVLSL